MSQLKGRDLLVPGAWGSWQVPLDLLCLGHQCLAHLQGEGCDRGPWMPARAEAMHMESGQARRGGTGMHMQSGQAAPGQARGPGRLQPQQESCLQRSNPMAEPRCYEQFLRTDLQAMPASKAHRKAESASSLSVGSSQYQALQRRANVVPPQLCGI